MKMFSKKDATMKENTKEKSPTKADKKKLDEWKRRYEFAKSKYADNLKLMDDNEALYNGDRATKINPNRGNGYSKKKATNVRNIVYELLESEVDSSIPMPKVTPIHEEDKELAEIIEKALENEVRLLRFSRINDVSERVTYVQGGDFYHVEWDHTKGFHCNIGGLSVNERHPRTVIPQPGCIELDEMDYVFVLVSQTKDFVKRKYNVDVSDAENTEVDISRREDDNHDNDLVTVIKCYYRNEDGKIGLFTWCEDYILEDYEDFQARRLTRCKKCGRVKVGETCECGSKSFETNVEEYEELTEDIIQFNGNVINSTMEDYVPQVDENGNPVLDMNGLPIESVEQKKVKVPYYKPNELPLVLRRNVSRVGKFLGASDAAIIQDQQEDIKKLGTKMDEKLLKGGSIVTLPATTKIQTTDEELKVVRVKNPNEVSMINVLNIQADVSYDRIMLESNYDWAKSTLGITDSFQGKYDSSAKSGTAKQYAINQAAGRLESKRVLKNEAFADLYRLMFKHLLAYADQPMPLSSKDKDGQLVFDHFNRYDFLKVDAAGEFYWDDEFIFETDPTSTIMMNREAMWQMIDLKYQNGAFGELGTPDALLTYWTFMEMNDYPNSSSMKDIFAQKVLEQKQMEAQQQQMAMMQAQMQQQMPPMGGM